MEDNSYQWSQSTSTWRYEADKDIENTKDKDDDSLFELMAFLSIPSWVRVFLDFSIQVRNVDWNKNHVDHKLNGLQQKCSIQWV